MTTTPRRTAVQRIAAVATLAALWAVAQLFPEQVAGLGLVLAGGAWIKSGRA